MPSLRHAIQCVVTATSVAVALGCAVAAAQANDASPAAYRTADSRVWKVEDPLFKELLGDQPMGYSADGAILWAHDWDHVSFGLQYGAVRTAEGDFRRWNAYQLHPLESLGLVKDPPLLGNLRRYREAGIKPAYYPYQYFLPSTVGDVPVDDRNGYVFVLDPALRERLLTGLKADIEELGDSIHSCQLLDEAFGVMSYQTVYFHRKFRGTREYPYILECDTEVRERFGFGKYGIPDDFQEDAPFKWIAMRRWIIYKALDLAREARAVVKARAPNVLFVSYDPPSQVQPGRYSLWGGVFDVIIHQVSEGATPSPYFSNFGYITKHLVDLSGAEVWPVPHVHNQQFDTPPNFTPEETIELMSQLLRNGARGLVVYMPDQPGLTKRRKYCFYSDYIGAPERYFTEVETVKIIAGMKQLKFPSPDFAVFYSNDANMARRGWPWNSDGANAWAYMLLGPTLRGWFRFIDDDQVERGTVDLSQFKAIFVPYAEYERRSAVEGLENYVSSGGTLICGDPTAFRAFDDGDSSETLRQKIFGVSVEPGTPLRPTTVSCLKGAPLVGGCTAPLPLVRCTALRVKAIGEAKVVATFEDGSPAIVMNALGRGRTLYFAVNPFTEANARDAKWQDFFRGVCEEVGVQLSRDIWRFKIPASRYSRLVPPIPAGTCLTGNYMQWTQSAPYSVKNLDTGGRYWLSPVPDAIGDVGNPAGFSSGKLTNRLSAPRVGNYENGFSQLSDWVVKWTNESAIDILFDFQRPYTVNRVAVFYQGQLPGATVTVRRDEADPWRQVAEDANVLETDGVDLKDIVFAPVSARWVKVSIPARAKGKALLISEAEVWSSEELASPELRPVTE